jgi:hemoglobin
MRNAHRKYVAEMGLNDSHFNIVASHLIATLGEFNVPDALIAEVGGALESLRDAVLDRPTQNVA